jgi:hypothetical protein
MQKQRVSIITHKTYTPFAGPAHFYPEFEYRTILLGDVSSPHWRFVPDEV